MMSESLQAQMLPIRVKGQHMRLAGRRIYVEHVTSQCLEKDIERGFTKLYAFISLPERCNKRRKEDAFHLTKGG
jgi:hypothetical protein